MMSDTPELRAPARAAGAPPAAKRSPSAKIDWLVFIGLGVLSLVPSLAGVVRVAGLASGTGMAPDNARFYAMPLPVVIHIICATLFCVLGIFQLAPNFRRRRLGWHRRVGWLLAPCGVGAGLSGLWMTQIYPLYPSIQDEVLYGLRIVFGSAMVVSIILSMAAILRRDIAGHRAWMIRGYAIGQGAGTQAVIGIPLFLIAGDQGGWVRNVMMGAGWVINVAVAEWIIRRKRAARQQPAPAPAAGIMSQA